MQCGLLLSSWIDQRHWKRHLHRRLLLRRGRDSRYGQWPLRCWLLLRCRLDHGSGRHGYRFYSMPGGLLLFRWFDERVWEWSMQCGFLLSNWFDQRHWSRPLRRGILLSDRVNYIAGKKGHTSVNAVPSWRIWDRRVPYERLHRELQRGALLPRGFRMRQWGHGCGHLPYNPKAVLRGILVRSRCNESSGRRIWWILCRGLLLWCGVHYRTGASEWV